MRIEGTSAVVSGGWLGLATARRLLGQGGRVVLLDLPSSAGEKTAAELGDGAVFVAGTSGPRRTWRPRWRPRRPSPAAHRGQLRLRRDGRAGPSGGTAHALDGFSWTVEVNLVGTFNLIRLAAARSPSRSPSAASGGSR